MVGCAGCLTRTIVISLNVLLLLAGLAVIGLGVYGLVQDISILVGQGLAYGVIALGVLCMIIATAGICGARTRVQKCWMWIYVILMTLVVLSRVAVIVLLITQEGEAKDFLEERWLDLTGEQRDELMKALECGSEADSSETCDGDDKCFDDCYDKAKDDLTTVGSALMIGSIVTVVVELILLICGICLLCEDDYDEDGYYQGENFSV